MKTLITARNPPIYITSASPRRPKIPTLHHHKKWKIHAQAKGFSKSTASSPSAKIMQTDTFPGKKYDNNASGDDKIPEVVFERMIARILFYVGAPMATGIVCLQVFNFVKENNLWDVPNWLPILTTFFTFGTSALGIAYGTLSTSLDPEKKGSVLGFEEAQRNWVELWKEEDER